MKFTLDNKNNFTEHSKYNSKIRLDIWIKIEINRNKDRNYILLENYGMRTSRLLSLINKRETSRQTLIPLTFINGSLCCLKPSRLNECILLSALHLKLITQGKTFRIKDS